MKALRICLLIFSLSLPISAVSQMQGRTQVVARIDTINDIPVYAVEWSSGDSLIQTDFYFEEGDYVRYYAVSHPGEDTFVIPGTRYLVKKYNLQVGDTWLAWFDRPTIAGVLYTWPDPDLESYVMYSDTLTGRPRKCSYFSEDVGIVHEYFWELLLLFSLTDYSIVCGSGNFPLHVGNRWTYDVTGIPESDLSFLCKTFKLSQNYPNPFNPITEIRYVMPKDCNVKLSIYNIRGQKVATLVDRKQKAGYKTARWDAGSLSSGIYFCHLQAGDFVQTRKMILLK